MGINGDLMPLYFPWGWDMIEKINSFNVHFVSQFERERERERMKLNIFIFIGRVIFLRDCDHTHEFGQDRKQMAVSRRRAYGDHAMQRPRDGSTALLGLGGSEERFP